MFVTRDSVLSLTEHGAACAHYTASGHCLDFVFEALTYVEAAQWCSGRGGALVAEDSGDIRTKILSVFEASVEGFPSEWWVGVRRHDLHHWAWVDDHSLGNNKLKIHSNKILNILFWQIFTSFQCGLYLDNHNKWASGRPLSPDANPMLGCALLSMEDNFLWRDADCTSKMGAICLRSRLKSNLEFYLK